MEFKSTWIEAPRAARRLAGHANAARGEPILWMIGVEENGAIASVNAFDFATWWPEVKSHFDGPVPLPTEVNVYSGDDSLICIAFETEEAPYAVRNPQFGQANAGPVEREVPWREMTAIRSARHDDLIRLLVPLTKLPEVEVLSGTLTLSNVNLGTQGRVQVDAGRKAQWLLALELYLVPRSLERLVFPIHRVRFRIEEPEALGEATFTPFVGVPDRYGPQSDRRLDLIVDGPGRLQVHGSFEQDSVPDRPGERATLFATLPPAGSDRSVILLCDFKRTSNWTFELSRWSASTTTTGGAG